MYRCVVLEPTEADIALLLAAKCHLGTTNVHSDMKKYMYTRRPDGVFIIHIGKLWEKLILAARVIVCAHQEDIYVTSSSFHGRRPANKISAYLGGTANCGRFPPGTFTKSVAEPTILICMDPRDDHQAISESSKCTIPVIAFANSHSSLRFVDVAIPCNNTGAQSIGVMCWLLTRAVLRLRGALNYDKDWKVIPDMFFYNEEDLMEQTEEDKVVSRDDGGGGDWSKNTSNFEAENWGGNPDTGGGSWQDEIQSAPTVPPPSLWTGDNDTFGSNDITFNLDKFPAGNPVVIDWAEDDPAAQNTQQNSIDFSQVEEQNQAVPPTDSSGWASTTPSSNTAKNWDSMKPSWD